MLKLVKFLEGVAVTEPLMSEILLCESPLAIGVPGVTCDRMYYEHRTAQKLFRHSCLASMIETEKGLFS